MRARWKIWEIAVVLCVAAVGFATFASAHIHVTWPLLGGLVFAALTTLGFLLGRRSPENYTRVLLAVTFGFAAAWLGLWNATEYDFASSYREWLDYYGASTEHYDTFVVAGFPLCAVEGHGGGGARKWLPLGKGLAALVSNFVILSLGFALFSTQLRGSLRPYAWSAVLLALGGGFFGTLRLVGMLD